MYGSGLPLDYPMQSWAKQVMDWRWVWLRRAVPEHLGKERTQLHVIKRWLKEGFMSADFTTILNDLIEARHGRYISFGFHVASRGYYR